MVPTPIGKQAVVVGAGMGGLTAAGALADHFEQVIVLERDTLPHDAAHRAGTPQGKHVHALLGGGQRALGTCFPVSSRPSLRLERFPSGWASTLASSGQASVLFQSTPTAGSRTPCPGPGTS